MGEVGSLCCPFVKGREREEERVMRGLEEKEKDRLGKATMRKQLRLGERKKESLTAPTVRPTTLSRRP